MSERSRPPGPTIPLPAIPSQVASSGTGANDPWAEYLAAAQRLDAVRRSATSIVSEQAQSVQAARQELSAVRARLAPQRSRMVHDLGLAEADLVPQPDDRAAAARAVSGGPAAALAALRQARATADAADAAILGTGVSRPWTPWMRNLLVYGPFAAAVLVVQVALYLIAPPGSLPKYALSCGLSMPVLAFGLAWVTIGFVFGNPGTRTDRTPGIGALVCLAPVLVTCMGVGLLAIVH